MSWRMGCVSRTVSSVSWISLTMFDELDKLKY